MKLTRIIAPGRLTLAAAAACVLAIIPLTTAAAPSARMTAP